MSWGNSFESEEINRIKNAEIYKKIIGSKRQIWKAYLMLLLVLNPTPKEEIKIVGLKALDGHYKIRWAIKVWVWKLNILDTWNSLER